MRPRGKELHNNAPKRVTTLSAAVDETDGQSFHPKLYFEEGIHNDALKRVTTPAGVAAIGVKT
jgi:hypothetical protein